MTSAPTTTATPQPDSDEHPHLRLRLKPEAPVTGRVDGGWWPRSRDLAAELPALLDLLAKPPGTVESVSYNLDDWGPAARKVELAGGLVRLAGYRSQHPGTVDVLAARRRITLLVVPPDTGEQAAQAALETAGQPGNTDEVEALLRISTARPVDDATAEPISRS